MSSAEGSSSLRATISSVFGSTSYPSGTSLTLVMVVLLAPSQSISWVSQSISSLMPFLQASSRFSASTTMCWYMGTRYWRSITNLDIGGFSGWIFQRPNPRQLLSAGVVWSAGPEGLQTEFLARQLGELEATERVLGRYSKGTQAKNPASARTPITATKPAAPARRHGGAPAATA